MGKLWWTRPKTGPGTFSICLRGNSWMKKRSSSLLNVFIVTSRLLNDTHHKHTAGCDHPNSRSLGEGAATEQENVGVRRKHKHLAGEPPQPHPGSEALSMDHDQWSSSGLAACGGVRAARRGTHDHSCSASRSSRRFTIS